jgi:mannosyltransferase OCH1-like enzyme
MNQVTINPYDLNSEFNNGSVDDDDNNIIRQYEMNNITKLNKSNNDNNIIYEYEYTDKELELKTDSPSLQMKINNKIPLLNLNNNKKNNEDDKIYYEIQSDDEDNLINLDNNVLNNDSDIGIDPWFLIGNEDVGNDIPKRIFQTHKSIEYIKNSDELTNAINSWRKYVPEYEYYLFTDELCDNFMKNIMTKEFNNIYYAYKLLPLGVMKADLWRYCVIYYYGGIYADVDTICLCNPIIFTRFTSNLVCAPEDEHSFFCQWMFAGVKKSPILKNVIELSIKRILLSQPIKGEHITHYITGPAVFSDAIKDYLKKNNMKVFKHCKDFWVYKNPEMICFKREIFHNSMIKHLFYGSKPDGWKKQVLRL